MGHDSDHPRKDGFASRVRRDFRRLRRIKGWSFARTLVDVLFFDAGFQALFLHRCAAALRRTGVPVLPAALRRWGVGSCAVDLLPGADLGGGCVVAHGVGLVVGGETVMGEDCTLLHGVTLGEVRFDETACPRLGDRVTVGAGALVLGGVTIGDDALIGAGAVVLHDVPAGARVAGVPARVVGWAAGYGASDAAPEPPPAVPPDVPTDVPPDVPPAVPPDAPASPPPFPMLDPEDKPT